MRFSVNLTPKQEEQLDAIAARLNVGARQHGTHAVTPFTELLAL